MKKGFTLVELVIVIIIVGILSIVAVPIYKGYTDRAKESEGKALVGSINTAEKVYLAEFGVFYGDVTSAVDHLDVLSIDARANKYYRTFTVTATSSQTFTATAIPVANSGLSNIVLTGYSEGQPVISGGQAGTSI